MYVDEYLVVLDKPAGLLAVPGIGPAKQDCLAARAQAMWPDARVVHRLDQATSGLIVMARGRAMQRALAMAFERREVSKRYVAVVAGAIEAFDGWREIDLPIMADWPNRPLQKVDAAHGRASTTRWRVAAALPQALEREQDATRVELQPLTGRTHQLRVHLSAVGHPILGDPLYAPAEARGAAARLMLHASELEFAHPATGEPIAFASRAPF